MKHNKITTIGSALVILLLASIIFMSHWQMSQLEYYEKKEDFTFKVIQHMDHLLSILREARNDQRKFTKTGEESFLISYQKVLKDIEKEVEVLNQLAGESPWLQQQLALIELQVKEKLADYDEQIKLRQQVYSQGATNGDVPRVKMSEIREHIATAKEEAIRQKQLLSARQEKDFHVMNVLLVINSAIIFILFITVLVVFTREIANRIKINERIGRLQEQERLVLSREVHDDIGQTLTALKLELSLIEKRLLPGDEVMAGQLLEMRNLLDQLLAKTHDITARLRPPLLDNLGLAEAIEWQVNEFRRRCSIEFFLMLNEDIRAYDENISLAIIRILQEALTNVIRHARATEVSISMCERRDEIVFEISDNGRGITQKEADSMGSYGIIGMRERALLFNGELMVSGNPGQGTIVSLTIPRDAFRENN